MPSTILITGVNGFVGGSIYQYLSKKKYCLKGVVRKKNIIKNKKTKFLLINNFDSKTFWGNHLKDVDIIVHAAGYPKFPLNKDKNTNNLKETNVLGTLNLVRQAEQYGVKKLIFISTVKVHGDNTKTDYPFCHHSEYNPRDLYALSKVDAEKKIENIRKTSKLDIIIIRPPIIYGKGMKSNFSQLISIVKMGIPLPFKRINKNKISLLSIENLNSFINACINADDRLNTNFVLSDDQTLSTRALIEKISNLSNKKAFIFYLPKSLLYILGYLFNKQNAIRFLLSSLEIDSSFSKSRLNWKPKSTLDKVLKDLIHE